MTMIGACIYLVTTYIVLDIVCRDQQVLGYREFFSWGLPALHGFRHKIHHQSSSIVEVRCKFYFSCFPGMPICLSMFIPAYIFTEETVVPKVQDTISLFPVHFFFPIPFQIFPLCQKSYKIVTFDAFYCIAIVCIHFSLVYQYSTVRYYCQTSLPVLMRQWPFILGKKGWGVSILSLLHS